MIRNYTHPVLRSDTDEIKGSAEINFNVTDNGDIIINPQVDNRELKELIQSDKATIHLDIVNKKCFHRRQMVIPHSEHSIELDPVHHPGGKYNVYGYVRINENNTNYELKSFHPDYKGAKFVLNKGAIISYLGSITFEYLKDFQTPQEKDSIFELNIHDDHEMGAFKVDYVSDTIQIVMNTNDHNQCFKTINAIDKSALVSMYIFPALIQAILDCQSSQYDDAHWADTILNVMEEKELNPDDPVFAAQRILADPINAITKSLTKLSMFEEEDE